MRSSKNRSKEEILSDLLTRGVEDVIDKEHLESELRSGKVLRVKLGIDPTSPNLHLGRAIPLRKLRDFQELGHKIVIIVGDFTAQVGDASDKLAKRPMLKREAINEYLKTYKDQLGKVIDLSEAEFRYNSEWLDKLGFQEIAELAEQFSVQQMLERRNFRDRFEAHEEISLREFMYPLMQGYDSVAVEADVELGGFDQLFNLKAGRVIQKHYGQKEQDLMTFSMLDGTDGRKMSSSWGNIIALNDAADDMFGKVMSIRDELIIKYFILCTDVSMQEIEKMESEIASGTNPRDLKVRLGKEIVFLYHGEAEAERVALEFDRVFRDKEIPSDIEEVSVGMDTMIALELLMASGALSSRGEGRRLIEQGGMKIDGVKIDDVDSPIDIRNGIVLQAGKHKFIKIVK
ncbi:MAG: tyrosine--tRNA ligase [Candidatus Colwellbacteria bacterium]|nr:tyrosine--tRNA ligase [Candidatus Colwellbacteria bacterium]